MLKKYANRTNKFVNVVEHRRSKIDTSTRNAYLALVVWTFVYSSRLGEGLEWKRANFYKRTFKIDTA